MNKKQTAIQIYQTAHLTGTFKLRSGQLSDEYFDKYMFESDPVLLKKIASMMKGNIPMQTEVLAGLEMGGIPLATAIASQTGHQLAFVRKTAKEYGTCKLVEGADVAGKHVCIVEDVVSTGGAIIDALTELLRLGAKIDTVLCVILRNPKAIETLAEHGLKLVPAFTMDYILKAANVFTK